MTFAAAEVEVSRFLAGRHRNLIDGVWQGPVSGKSLEAMNPSTGRVLAEFANGDATDIDLAVRAARRSFDDQRWRGLSGDERAQVLWRFAELLEAHGEELKRIDILNNGMTLELAGWSVTAAATWLRDFAGLTGRVFGKNGSGAMSGGGVDIHAYTAREPVGVVGLITPWNGPLGSFVVKVGPALAAGCSLIVKPAENTPLSALRLAELAMEAGLPAGVLNVVTGLGPTAGQALVDHPDVDKVSFTGSTATGRQIIRSAAANMKRVTLELGGKSPLIVFDDADPEITIPGAVNAIFMNAGQVCLAGSRLFVERKSFDKVLEGVAEAARSIRLGSGLDPATEMGPLISAKQKQRVGDYIALGRKEGAAIVVGGEPIDREGYFVQPTVFANVKPDMRIAREEIFGPVLVATRFDDLNEVIDEANDTRYGLGSGIFTRDVNKAHLVAGRLRAGNVWINCYGLLHQAMPFGGYKESGWGREMGTEAVDGFLETKSVFIQLKTPMPPG